jgi:hypothetical protein
LKRCCVRNDYLPLGEVLSNVKGEVYLVFIIFNTTNTNAQRILNAWAKPGKKDRKNAQRYFIRQFGPGTYLMEANGAVLALLYDLKRRHDGDVYIYAAKPLVVISEFPKEVIEVVEKCQKLKRDILEKDLEPLEKIEINCSVNWKRGFSQ